MRELTGGTVTAMTKVKICGITRLEDAELAISLGAWALGFMLWPPSKRYVDPASPPGSSARCGARSRPWACSSTSRSTRSPTASTSSASRHVQLHGDEGPSFCSAVAQRTGAKVIKAVRIGHAADLRDLERFHTDYHLLDTSEAGLYGGTGKTWDWKLVAQPPQQDPADPLRRADRRERRRRRSRRCGRGASTWRPASSPRRGSRTPAKLEAFFAAVRDARRHGCRQVHDRGRAPLRALRRPVRP